MQRTLLIGRDPACQVALQAPSVSWRHARLAIADGRYLLQDLGSTNGTFVNGQRVAEAEISPRDVICLGDCPLAWSFILGCLQTEGQSGLAIECLGLEVATRSGKRKLLLHNVTFSAHSGQLIAIIGPSGAGKSTLVRALVGLMPPSHGAILCNGTSLGLCPELVCSWVGYVPQDDIIHAELTVQDALRFSCELRVPGERSAANTARRVLEAADLCRLTPHLGKTIRTLSGGERKRASVAVELLTRPPILVFDEPTSGLDPALERGFMDLSRHLADDGHLVFITTHVTRSLELCDRVLILAGGREVYFGPPRHLSAFFKVDDIADLYDRLEDPAQWAQRFVASPVYQKYVAQPLAEQTPVPLPGSRKIGGAVRQFSILVRRYLAVLRGDTRNLAFLCLQAPVIAAVTATVFPPDVFTEAKSYAHAPSLLFIMVMAALWFGTTNSAREIVKERGIYLRERTVGLSIVAYLTSKLLPLLMIGALQALVLVVVLGLRTHWFGEAGARAVLGVWGLLALAAASGTGMGLLISAFAGSPDQSISLTPILLLPQLVFSGVFAAVEQAGGLTTAASRLAPSNWCFSALGHWLDLNKMLAKNPATAQLQNDAFDRPLARSVVILLVMAAALFAAAWVALAVKREKY